MESHARNGPSSRPRANEDARGSNEDEEMRWILLDCSNHSNGLINTNCHNLLERRSIGFDGFQQQATKACLWAHPSRPTGHIQAVAKRLANQKVPSYKIPNAVAGQDTRSEFRSRGSSQDQNAKATQGYHSECRGNTVAVKGCATRTPRSRMAARSPWPRVVTRSGRRGRARLHDPKAASVAS